MSNQKSTIVNTQIPRTPLRFLCYLGSKYPWLAAASFLLVLLAEALNVLILFVSARLVDNFTIATSLSEQQAVLLYWGGLFLLVYFSHLLFYRISGYVVVDWVIKFHKDGYNQLYDYLTKHSHTYFGNRFAGALSNKVSNAVDSSAGLAFQIVWSFFSELVGLLVTLVLFFSIDIRIGLALLTTFALVLSVNIWAVKKRRPYVVTYAEANSKSRGEGVDVITNIGAVRNFAAQPFELKRLAQVFDDRAKKDRTQSFLGEHIMVANTIFAVLMTTLVLYLLYGFLGEGSITPGVLVLVLGLLGRIGYMFIMVGQDLNRFIRDYGNIEEGLKEILQPHEIVDQPDAKKLSVSSGQIQISNLLFNHEATKVFDNFNLLIKAGERVGLVGPSGAGKSTLVSLLLRQYEVGSGSISIDGQDIRQVTQDSLRREIAVVPQEPALFHRSIRDNIAYGLPEATIEEIVAVAKKAEVHDFVSVLPDGYDTLVGERGVKLSGGQKQRIAIARALIKNAPILILDEATSALDSESEVAIQKALHVLMEGKTVIAIAHRLSTLREMDRIVVLENGRVTEDGPHHELQTAGGTYQRLWEHQAGGFMQEE